MGSTQLNRRTFFLAAAIAAPALGAVSFTEEMLQGDTAIRLIDASNDIGFMVGVRTKVECDEILVSLFYRDTIELVSGNPIELTRSLESIAPCVGWDAYGGTRRSFPIPREKVKFIRLEFLREVGTRAEFGRG